MSRSYTPLQASIIHLVHRLPGDLTRTKLVKLLYLLDLTHAKQHGRPVTNVTYRSYYYGPFSSEILNAIRSLDAYEIQEGMGISHEGKEFYTYTPGHNARGHVPPKLPRRIKETLDHVIEKYGKLSLDDLLEVAYDTKAFKRTRKGGVINLSP